jgi:hypothetical protein
MYRITDMSNRQSRVKSPHPVPNETFRCHDHDVVIRSESDHTEIVIEGVAHQVMFLDNGRPYTRAYVNAMATSVRDLANRFVAQKVAEEAHWAKLANPPTDSECH